MLLLSFIFLNITFLVLLGIIFYFKEQNKTYPLYALFILLIFYTPSIYYFLGGTSYRLFDDSTFISYMNYSSLIIGVNAFFLIIKNSTIIKPIKNDFLVRLKNGSVNLYLLSYFSIILLITLGYISYYFKDFPLISFLLTGILMDRPDTTGSIPHFYTISTIMLFIIPSIYIYFLNKIKSNTLHVIILALIGCFLAISGHKGMITFFAIFYWYYVLQHKINFKFIIIICVLLLVYSATKGINNFSLETLEYLMNSPTRRFFVTQGACMITRFHMVDINYVLNNIEPIKNQVCNVMHQSEINAASCSAPTFFIGDIIIKHGFVVATIVYILSAAIIFWIIKIIDINYNNNLFIKWNLFCFLYLIGMAEVDIYGVLRVITLIAHVYIVCFLSSLKFDYNAFLNLIRKTSAFNKHFQ